VSSNARLFHISRQYALSGLKALEKTIFTIVQKIVLSTVLLISATLQTHAETHHYTVQLKNDLTGLSVKACFSRLLPSRLISYRAPPIQLKTATLISNRVADRNIPVNRHGIDLPPLKQGDCISYSISFKDSTAHLMFKNRQSTNQQILIDIHSWLLFPDNFNAEKHALDITFQIPRGMNISTPWPVLEKNSPNHINNKSKSSITYHYTQRPEKWKGLIAIGKFKTTTLLKGAAKIQIAILNGHEAVNSKKLMLWINKNLDALLMAYGEFPVPALQLLVVPTGKDHEPVRWGQAMRGGGDAVHVYIDQTRSLNEFLKDWVLIHELSHLLHPRFYNASWFSEGLASYYQNVLGARSRLLTQHRAWQKLHDGFQRGIRGTSPDINLSQASESMMQTGSFMRVYWSGAAISLLADYELRRLSNNEQSLDTALKKFRHCCLPSRSFWSDYKMIKKMDELSDTNVFSHLYQQYLTSTNFPDLSTVYSELGLRVKNNRIEFDNSLENSAIRRSITSPEK